MPRHNNSPWTTSDISQWADICKDDYLLHVPSGTLLFDQMQRHEYIYLVCRGRVATSVINVDGREQYIMFSEAGSLFGESCLYERGKQIYRAVTITDTDVYRIPATIFRQTMVSSSAISIAAANDFYKKSALFMSQCIGFTLSDIPRRLIGTLFFVADMYGQETPEGVLLHVHITQQELADLINASRVSVNRIFRQLTKEGLIRKNNGYYILTNPERLQNLAIFI